MALQKDFLKRAKRDVKVPSDDLVNRLETDDPEDTGEVAEVVAAPAEKPAEAPAEAKAPETPEAKPEVVEAKGKPDAKPAEKVEPKKDEDKVPVGLMVSERKRGDAAEKALRDAEQRLRDAEARLAEAAKPKVEDKKEPEDLEPDRATKPIEWSEWKTRELDRRTAAVEKREQEREKRDQARDQEVETVRMKTDIQKTFNNLLDAAATGTIPERVPHIPDIKEREAFVRERQYQMNLANGVEDATAKAMVDEQLIVFLGQQFSQKLNPIAGLSKMADLWGYVKPAEAAKPAAVTAKPATERMKDQQNRESAARTTSTMPGAAPKAAADADMTADKFTLMTPQERKAWKKANPGFKLDRLMANV